jgi:alkanesulfonate monooxygenase SsuD/methylene tetrahydromethanopterin reductase-like flavin-dependent oxidoreductase (luciferase family)
MSPESVDAAADLGARLVIFSQRPAGDQKADWDRYCERFRTAHDREPGPMITCDFVYCDTDRRKAEDIAHEHLAGYLHSVMDHYELMSDHFKTAKGYETYGSTVDLMKAVGLETIAEHYVDAQAWGTPDDVIGKLKARAEVLGGDYDLNCCFRYAGLPVDLAEQSLRTFGEHVLPVMRA